MNKLTLEKLFQSPKLLCNFWPSKSYQRCPASPQWTERRAIIFCETKKNITEMAMNPHIGRMPSVYLGMLHSYTEKLH